MALVARPVQVSTTPSVVANRPVSSTRSSGTQVNSVDSVTPSSNGTLGDDVFSSVVNSGDNSFGDGSYFSGRHGGSFENRDGRDDTQQNAPPIGIITSTTENFVKLIELRDAPLPPKYSSGVASNGLPPLNIFSRAVSIYETTVNILATDQNVRGETLSYTV